MTIDAELELAKSTAQLVVEALCTSNRESLESKYSSSLPKELKANIDRVMEDLILGELESTGITVLSEEAGILKGKDNSDLKWIVDPLDGTVNYVRGVAPSAVSIALWEGSIPIFGVIAECPTGKIAWGGQAIGAFMDERPLKVSDIDSVEKAILCTGFPARFEFGDCSAQQFFDQFKNYAKVRMLGCASLSLLKVANGSADVYHERDVMVWDVAAGIAIVQGAGGRVDMEAGRIQNSLNVFASNNTILDGQVKYG